MPRPLDPSRDLLFGLLALQTGLINQGQLVAAFHAWTQARDRPMAEILAEQGALATPCLTLLEGLVIEHLRRHGNDPERSLAAIGVGQSTRECLAQIGNAELDASLTHVGAGSVELDADADRTASYAVGTATSDGQRFRVLRPHARGGLGAVFVALDTELHREVALKQILDDHADEPTGRQRFLLEAEVTGGLEHPGIVPVYGLGTYGNGRPYYAMRFIHGDSLKDAIELYHSAAALRTDPGKRSLELRKLLRRFVDVCNAIDYAHSRGVLHRDLKPGNIIVGKYGETLVVDWGLAKATGRSDPASGERTLRPASARGSAETLPGSALGTPAYMSPEQAEGDLEHLGPRSDVYSLGATLYCLLTGKPPFTGDAVEVIPRVQRGDFPPPRALDPSIDRALEAVCRKAMALRPEDRHGSCRALAEDLEGWMADEPVTAWREPLSRRARRWMRRHRTAVAAVVVALVLGLGVAASVLVASLRREAEVGHYISEGQRSAASGELELAMSHFETAARLARGDAGRLGGWLDRIGQEYALASATKNVRDKADRLFRDGEHLRFALLGFGGDLRAACGQVESALAKFSIPDDPAWFRQKSIGLLDRPRRDRMIGEVNELLFLWVFALDRERHGDPVATRRAIQICDVALASAPTAGPWQAMRARCAATLAGEPPPSQVPARADGETSARGCFQWVLLCDLEERTESAVAWLDRATMLEPSDYWSHFYLGDYLRRIGRNGRAMEHLQAAVALRPDSPWARCNRALLYSQRGDWELALDDLERVLASHEGADLLKALHHTDTLMRSHNLATAGWSAGRLPEAIALHEATLKLLEAKLGPDHPLTLTSRNNLATAYQAAGRLSEAIALHQATLRLYEARLGPDHPDTLMSRGNLASAHESLGGWAAAEGLRRDVVARRRNTVQPNSPLLAGDLANLGRNLLKQVRWSEAKLLLRECLAICEMATPDDWSRYDAMSLLGGALRGQGQYAEAEPLVVEGYQGMKARAARIPVPERSRLREAAERIVPLYEEWNKPNQATAWKAKLGMPDLPAEVFARP
jgi:tetratricopeptide (TPR) repeat protein/tRNA A-37 threonylcarbamoyl transferase component Bud32